MTLQDTSSFSHASAKLDLAEASVSSNEHYKNLIQSLPQAIFESNRQGQWSFLSKGWQLLSGFTVNECVGQSYLNYVHPQDRERCRKVFENLQHSNSGQCTEVFRFLIKDGNYLWLEVHAVPLWSDEQQFLGVVGTLINITDRVSEEELLLANHRTLTAMLNDLPGMVYRCRNNPDWTMEYVSGSSYALTGYHPQDIVNNTTLSYGSMIHHEDKQAVWDGVQNGVREDRRFDLVYRIVTATGKEKWVWERGIGIFSDNDELLGIEGFVTDITHKRHAEVTQQQKMLYDPVTDLPTLHLFMDRVKLTIYRTAQTDQTSALFVIHLDKALKEFENLDIKSLDDVAREIGQRLLAVVNSADSVTRINNERWGILIENINKNKSLKHFSQQILDGFLSSITVGESQVYVTLSMGVALTSHLQPDAEKLLRSATCAMQRAHELGGRRYEVFDPGT
jgi:PAS domain S-box-containing protein/diguanylate cyclase (GGDEF)-like protein